MSKKSRPSCNNLNSPHCYRSKNRTRVIRECFCGSALQATGPISPGCEIFGFTKGQFSLMDLVVSLLKQTGPASVDISTWTAANADMEHCYQFLKSGKITSARWVLDRSFPNRQREYFNSLLDRFGLDAVRLTHTHAKFVTIKNEDWNIVLRSSMNLNKNPRFENFEISDDPAFCDYFTRLVDEVFENMNVGRAPKNKEIADAFKSVEVVGETYNPLEFKLEGF